MFLWRVYEDAKSVIIPLKQFCLLAERYHILLIKHFHQNSHDSYDILGLLFLLLTRTELVESEVRSGPIREPEQLC